MVTFQKLTAIIWSDRSAVNTSNVKNKKREKELKYSKIQNSYSDRPVLQKPKLI